jgi:NarL family two-component system sensor histidine kinase LiaS
MAEQLQNLLHARQKLASLEARNRLARDLHDSVKQQVFAVSMQLRTAKMLLKHDADEAKKHLQEAEQLVQKTQQELTALVRELRPIALENKGFVAALRELVTDWSRQTTIHVSLHLTCEQALPFTLEEALFRVVQEALANIARHSGATTVSLSLLCEEDNIQLSISDNGKGFETESVANIGLGLSSMRERIEALGGHIEIKSKPTIGTTITVQCQCANVVVQGV